LFLLAVLVAGAIVAALAWRASRVRLAPDLQRRATRVLVVAIAAACVAGIVGVALHGGSSSTGGPNGAHCVQTASRLACPSSDARLDWWKQSWQLFTGRPLKGAGAGSFGLAHQLHRTKAPRPAEEPHNFAVQVLGETGSVGFALLAGFVVFAVLAVRRRVRGDDAGIALALCALAYGLHALIDIDYDFVSVSAPFFLVLGFLLAERGPTLARREVVWAVGIVALAATAILSLAAPVIAERKVNAAINAPTLAAGAALAQQAHTWNPVSIVPLETEAAIEEALKHKLDALRLYHQAVETQPDNPAAYVQLGEFELRGMKDPCLAYRYLNQAYTLDPVQPQDVLHELDRVRQAVNRGACGS
jgi:hypothetical protein